MSKHLAVVLGAGFSANAGMPTASDIGTRFDRNLKEKLLSASSSEWMWIDGKSDAEKNNGILNFDYLAYSYVFDELVRRYKADRGSFIYYEDFYQFIIDNFSNYEWVEDLFSTSKDNLLMDRPYLNENDYNRQYLFPLEKKQFQKVSDILNYLIGDMLTKIPKSDEELLEIYKGFINYIVQFESVDIFTLNHDLLLERILELNGIPYSKGFNTENSPIIHNDLSVPFFNNSFNASIKIHKLHGSLDFYQFRHHLKSDGLFWQLTGEYDYYMTTNYSTKHNSKRIDPNTGEMLQDYNFDIVPKFITGTKKLDTIENDFLFKQLFQNFNEVIDKAENLLVSGYSFSDDHLNDKLKSKEFNYINHNRSKEYPFGGIGKNITSLDDL